MESLPFRMISQDTLYAPKGRISRGTGPKPGNFGSGQALEAFEALEAFVFPYQEKNRAIFRPRLFDEL